MVDDLDVGVCSIDGGQEEEMKLRLRGVESNRGGVGALDGFRLWIRVVNKFK
jgi:hypothetical protein